MAPRLQFIVPTRAPSRPMPTDTNQAHPRSTAIGACECRALVSLGFLHIQGGSLESARAYVETALSIARELNDRSIESGAYNVLGNLESVLGRREQALASYDTALALAREAGDRQREGNVLSNLGNEYAQMGIMVISNRRTTTLESASSTAFPAASGATSGTRS